MDEPQFQYVGFWSRVVAAIVDTILTMIIVAPLVTWIYGSDYWLDPTKGLMPAPQTS